LEIYFVVLILALPLFATLWLSLIWSYVIIEAHKYFVQGNSWIFIARMPVL